MTINNKVPTSITIGGKEVTSISINNSVVWSKVVEVLGLPEEYQEVEYISANTNVYIDSKINIDPNMIVDLDLAFDSKNSTDHGAYVNNKRFHVGCYSSNIIVGIGDGYNDRISFNTMLKYKILMYNTTTPYVLVDGTRYTATNKSFSLFTQTGTFLFFRKKTNESGSNNMKYIYHAKFSVGSTVVGDFVPCYRKADNKVGLYNLVTKEFLTSGTTSDPNKGPDVNN